MIKPLEGIKVIDLTRALAGPYCTMILADLGAEVIKVEPPQGDDTRQWGPPFLPNTTDSAYYAALNRNKKSISINLKTLEGKEILKKLISKADIFVENFRVGTLEKLGFGYTQVKEMKKDIIYCSINGFGSTGPYSKRGGYDIIIQGMGGLMSITGEPDGEPMRVGVPIVDITTGMFAVQGILAGIISKYKTGEGQYIETSLLESQVAWLTNVASNYLISGKLPKRLGNLHPNITPYQPYKTKDGYIIVAVGSDKLWKEFCKAIEREDLIENEDFCTNDKRNQNRDKLNEILENIFIKKTTEEWNKILLNYNIPCGPINTLDKVFSDPQVLYRNMLIEVEHPKAGKIKLVGIPIKFSKSSLNIYSHPPLLGEHTEEILLSLGYSSQDIKNFFNNKIIFKNNG